MILKLKRYRGGGRGGGCLVLQVLILFLAIFEFVFLDERTQLEITVITIYLH